MVRLDTLLEGWESHNIRSKRSHKIHKRHLTTLQEAVAMDYSDRQLLEYPGTMRDVEGRVVAFSLLKSQTNPLAFDDMDALMLAHSIPFPDRFYPREGRIHSEMLFWRYVKKKDPVLAMLSVQSLGLIGAHQESEIDSRYAQFVITATNLRAGPFYSRAYPYKEG